jgi:putative RNA 2'-phosphotransferase
MQSNSDMELGRFISLILRHKPETIGIKIDENGWAYVDELLKGINKSGKKINRDILDRIVEENNKKRYSYNEDKTKIRANQGHSVKVDVELKEVEPLEKLYHGTAARFLDSIRKDGLIKQGRLHVHLSGDEKTAFSVGKRHGKPEVLIINAQAMFEDGYKFYLSENGVWLVESVPVKYIGF